MFKKIIVLLVLFTSIILSQSWNDIKTTNISIANANYAEMFSNSFGNNVILQNTNGSITYYVANASTGLAGNAITVVTSGASLAQITGETQKIYVIYKNTSTNKIVTKYTTNAGLNWNTDFPDLNVNPTTLDAVAYGGKIHITYTQDNKAHYYQYDGSSWTKYKDISGSELGINPSIELLPSSNKLYVAYNGPNGSAKSRECDIVENSWNELKTLYSYLNYPVLAGFGVDANYIYLYYSTEYNSPPYFYYTFYTRTIQKSDYTTVSLSWETYNPTQFVQTATTYDNKVHTAYQWFEIYSRDGYQSFELEPGLIHDNFNSGTRNVENIEVNYNYEYYYNVEVSSASNDIFVLWKPQNSSTLKYCNYDAAPLAPSNYAVSVYQSGTNYYPSLTWSLNSEPDVRQKTSNAYKIERRTRPLNGTWSSWSVLANLSGTTSSYIDYSINNASGGDREAEYRITAVDEGNNSSPAQSVIIEYGMYIQDKIKVSGMVRDYSLDQNYPNPFNPSTKIIYSIKEEGLVILKVYDILGKEIATLVNENKPAGNYEAEFNASQLPSGMYIYKIQSGQFSDVKKMLLTK